MHWSVVSRRRPLERRASSAPRHRHRRGSRCRPGVVVLDERLRRRPGGRSTHGVGRGRRRHLDRPSRGTRDRAQPRARHGRRPRRHLRRRARPHRRLRHSRHHVRLPPRAAAASRRGAGAGSHRREGRLQLRGAAAGSAQNPRARGSREHSGRSDVRHPGQRAGGRRPGSRPGQRAQPVGGGLAADRARGLGWTRRLEPPHQLQPAGRKRQGARSALR